jgi:hypothetical protein
MSRGRAWEKPGRGCPSTVHEQSEAEQLRDEVQRLSKALQQVNAALAKANQRIAKLEESRPRVKRFTSEAEVKDVHLT